MDRLFLYLLVITSFWGNAAMSQSSTYSDQWVESIYEKYRHYRELNNEDSTLYFADLIIEYKIRTNNKGGTISRSLHKVNDLITFGRFGDAFELTLYIYDRYCKENSDSNLCRDCSKVYQRLAYFMEIMKDYSQGIVYLDKSCWLKVDPMISYKKAFFYYRLNRPSESITTAEEFVSLSKNQENPQQLITAYNNYGLILIKLGKIEEAIEAFSNAIEIAKESSYTIDRYAYIIGNLGSCYFEKGENHMAYKYLCIDAEESLKIKSIESYLSAALIIAKIDVLEQRYRKAIVDLTSLLANYDDEIIVSMKIEMTELIMQSHKALGDESQYTIHQNKWVALNKFKFRSELESSKELFDQFASNSLEQIRRKFAMEKELDNQKRIIEKGEIKEKELKTGILLLGLIFIIMFILFAFWRYRILQKKKLVERERKTEFLRDQQEILEFRIKEEKMNVNFLSLELNTKLDFSKTILKKLHEFDSIPKSDLNNLSIFIDNELSIKSSRANLQSHMGDLTNIFYSELKIRHPELNESDVILAGMVVMNMSNKEIAISKNITLESAKKSKNRLKKKISIQPDKELDVYLKSFLID